MKIDLKALYIFTNFSLHVSRDLYLLMAMFLFSVSQANCGDRHIWKPCAYQGSRDWPLHLHDQEREAHWQGEKMYCLLSDLGDVS